MLDRMFITVLEMTAASAIVIAAVLLLRLLLRKTPRVATCMLWAVVLFRLLCPVTLQLPVSPVPQIASVEENYTLANQPISFLGAAEAAAQAATDGEQGVQYIRLAETDAARNPLYASSSWWEVWIVFGKYVWLAGVLAMVLTALVSYVRLRLRLRTAMPLQDRIWLADEIDTPFVLGIFRPKIYLPSALQDREYIILHEQCHIRHGDLLWKLLGYAALCIHWFNPLVWVAFLLAGKDMEMRCDESVVSGLGSEVRADYASALLKFSTGRRNIGGVPLAFGEGNPKSRIRNIIGWKKPATWAVIAAVVVCVAASVLLVTTRSDRGEQVIYLDGQYYSRVEGTVQDTGGAWYAGELRSILHNTEELPEENASGTNLNEKYAGCPIYVSMDNEMLYLKDYLGYYLPFARVDQGPADLSEVGEDGTIVITTENWTKYFELCVERVVLDSDDSARFLRPTPVTNFYLKPKENLNLDLESHDKAKRGLMHVSITFDLENRQYIMDEETEQVEWGEATVYQNEHYPPLPTDPTGRAMYLSEGGELSTINLWLGSPLYIAGDFGYHQNSAEKWATVVCVKNLEIVEIEGTIYVHTE